MRIVVAGVLAAAIVAAVPVHATSQRTFVASGGSDANPCTLAAPCRTFAAAIAQTSASGEVIVLDSAGYGQIASITQSVSIIAPAGVYAGISVVAGDGITINGPGISVALVGLAINGQGGGHGVMITDADTVHVEGCTFANLYGTGIYQLAGKLYAKDTVIRYNNGGVYVQGPAQATLDRVRIEGNQNGLTAWNGGQATMQDSHSIGNGNRGVHAYVSSGNASLLTIVRSVIAQNWFGVEARSDATGVAAKVDIYDSSIVGNAQSGLLVDPTNGGLAVATLVRTSVTRNATGINLLLSGASVALDATTIVENTTGVASATGTTVYSRSSSMLRDNTTATSGTSAGAPTSVAAY